MISLQVLHLARLDLDFYNNEVLIKIMIMVVEREKRSKSESMINMEATIVAVFLRNYLTRGDDLLSRREQIGDHGRRRRRRRSTNDVPR